MNLAVTTLLGAIAGFTIFLGLPIARLKNPPRFLQGFLNALATGILVFLLWDVITKATEPIDVALVAAQHGNSGDLILLLFLFAGGFGVGLLSLVYFEGRFLRRARANTGASTGESVGAANSGSTASLQTPMRLAMMMAIGIGLHNFSEGLAIGQASSSGAISFATILIVGFGLHNMTEGFGIAAPLTAASRPSWGFLALMGLIAGGPTFLGTILGYSVQSEAVFVLFLSLAAGSIFYVVTELLNVGRRFPLRELAMFGVFLGFLAGYGTDLILTWAGA